MNGLGHTDHIMSTGVAFQTMGDNDQAFMACLEPVQIKEIIIVRKDSFTPVRWLWHPSQKCRPNRFQMRMKKIPGSLVGRQHHEGS
jgi:hypothetical protein